MTCEFLRAAFRMQLLSWSSPAFSEIRRALVDLLWDIPESSTITKIITKSGVTSILKHSSQSINSFFAGNRQKNNLKQLPEKRQGEFFARLAALSDKKMDPTPKTRHGIKIMQHSWWHLLRIIPGMKKYEECKKKTKTCLISCHSVIVKGDMLHSTQLSTASRHNLRVSCRIVSYRVVSIVKTPAERCS